MKVKQTKTLEREGVALAEGAFSSIGFLFREQTVHDNGIDAHVEVVDGEQATGRLLALQIKTGASYFAEADDLGFIFRSDDEHISYWLRHSLPVLVVLCEPQDSRIIWQVVAENTAESTGKGWKILVPSANTIDIKSRSHLLDLATKVVAADRYSVLEQRDISVGIAKRYRLKIVLNGEFSKPEIATVVRQVVAKSRTSRYHRSREIAARWGDSDASIISLFVFLSIEDVRDNNWICNCLWIDDAYPDDLPRPSLGGENIGAGIVADWSTGYDSTAKLLRSKRSSKEDYLETVEDVVPALVMLFKRLVGELEREAKESDYDPGAFLLAASSEIRQLNDRVDKLGRIPLECEEVDLKFHSLLGHATNVVAPFLVSSTSPQRNKFVEQYSIEDFGKTLPQFQYELEKIR